MGIGSFSVGFTIGFGSGLVSREIIPIVGEIVRPIARVSIKTTIKIVERSREVLFRSGEIMEDLIAEVQTELKKDRSKKMKGQMKVSKRTQAPTPPIDISEARKAA